MKIDITKVVFLQKRKRDDVGEVFEYEGKILRGIFHEKTEMVKEEFSSGFIGELIFKNYFPNTFISEYKSKDYGVILEHQKIWPVLYPQEWSYSMLRESALMVIEVAKIARNYGYNMKDCHGFNVLVDCGTPKFIDLGSFYKASEDESGWYPYTEFLRFYYYPLFTWKDGLEYISKLSIFSANLTPHAEHYIYKFRLLRFLGLSNLEKLLKLRFMFHGLTTKTSKKIEEKSGNTFVKWLLIITKEIAAFYYGNSRDLNRLKKKIQRLSRPETATIWKSYHSEKSKKKDRFKDIVDLVNTHCSDARSAIDIAGNQGLFSKILLLETSVAHVICQDLDEQSIDMGYLNSSSTSPAGKYITYVNYNAIAPIVKTTHPPPWERFHSDIVFSLALLHHLVLTQGFSLEDILFEISRYSKKYICIEFMPKGLWVHGSKVSIPDWYTVDWFRGKFKEYFELLEERQIAENYIVYFGKKMKCQKY